MSISLKYVVKPTLGFHGAPQGVGSLNQSGSGDWLRYVQQSEANVYNGLNNLHEMRGRAGVRSKKNGAHSLLISKIKSDRKQREPRKKKQSKQNKISYLMSSAKYSLAIGSIAIHIGLETTVSPVPSHANNFNDKQCRSQLPGQLLKGGYDEYVASKTDNICNCMSKYPGDKSDKNKFIVWGVRCIYFEGTPTSNSGQRSMNYGMRNVFDFSFSLVSGSIVQIAPNGNYGRYIQFFVTQDRTIKGSPAYTIPGKPAQIIPGTPGRTFCGNQYAGYDFATKSARYTYVCRTMNGTPDRYIPAQEPQYIPAVPDRMVTDRKKVIIDCNDKTFDIADDGKKWSKIIPGSEYSWVSSIETIVCPFIDQHQRI